MKHKKFILKKLDYGSLILEFSSSNNFSDKKREILATHKFFMPEGHGIEFDEFIKNLANGDEMIVEFRKRVNRKP